MKKLHKFHLVIKMEKYNHSLDNFIETLSKELGLVYKKNSDKIEIIGFPKEKLNYVKWEVDSRVKITGTKVIYEETESMDNEQALYL